MLGLPDDVVACLFDLDGVLTDTASVHDKAWTATFDDYLRERAGRTGEAFVPFDPGADYDTYVDGKKREDGVRDFLASRGITLPEGTPDDAPGTESVHGIGNRKNVLLLERIREDGVEVYEGSRRYLQAARDAGLRRALVSSSANAADVLRVTGLDELIEVRVDGVTARERNLPGKPAPDNFLAAAELLGVPPAKAAVFEDALAGVQAGRAGAFGCVVGVDRVGQADELKARGADVVVQDLDELPVTGPSGFPVEPWQLRETSLDLDRLAQSESLFALSNGHIGLRGNLDEGEPYGIPGTYLNSFYEQRPLPYAEAGYGYPESGQTVVNVTNGKLLRLLVDDEPFDVRYGTLTSHERVLDLRTGLLSREAEWVSPAGRTVKVRSSRLVSFSHRSVAAICYEVEAVDERTRVIVQSELVANEAQPALSGDPRVAAVLDRPLEAVELDVEQAGAMLLHRTRTSDLLMGAVMDHEVTVPGRVDVQTEGRDDWARTTVACILRKGEVLRIVKYLAYGWSGQRSQPALRDQVDAALTGARYAGWDGLVQEQRDYLDDFWDAADVEVEGDPVVQQAVRFGLFHVLQAGARAEHRAIAAKGLTGPGYDGHAFWDTEGFVLPVLTYTQPDAAADALRWRHSILGLAQERATTLGLEGAAFPWRTIRGQECSAYWPAGTAAFHLNADIAYAFERHRVVTGDDALEREVGLEVLVQTARMWASLGHHDVHGVWHVDGVTGPDEYTAVMDDNVFTNLMAAKNLRIAAAACGRHPQQAAELGVTTEETAAWRDGASAVHLPYDKHLEVHQQSVGFTRYAEWDFERYRDAYPLLLSAPYVQLYRKQVIKQADLVLAMHWCGEHFTPEQKARNVDYYERRTVRDSSLSACTQAVLCAEVGHLELAHDYLSEAALVDLHDLHRNTKDGLHMASLAGTWTALVEGFGGLRERDEQLCLDPQLPPGLTRLAFRLRWRGVRLLVEVSPEEVRCSVRDGSDARLELSLAGEAVTVTTDEPVVRPLTKRRPLLPRPHQPPGREPVARQSAPTPDQGNVAAAAAQGGAVQGRP